MTASTHTGPACPAQRLLSLWPQTQLQHCQEPGTLRPHLRLPLSQNLPLNKGPRLFTNRFKCFGPPTSRMDNKVGAGRQDDSNSEGKHDSWPALGATGLGSAALSAACASLNSNNSPERSLLQPFPSYTRGN